MLKFILELQLKIFGFFPLEFGCTWKNFLRGFAAGKKTCGDIKNFSLVVSKILSSRLARRRGVPSQRAKKNVAWPWASKNGQKFLQVPSLGQIRFVWAQIWPKFKIFITHLYHQEKHPDAWYLVKLHQKGLGVSIYTPQATHFRRLTQTPNFHHFHSWTRNPNFEMCHMGAYTHPKPFFWKFLGFLKKIEHFSYLYRLCTIKTRQVVLM